MRNIFIIAILTIVWVVLVENLEIIFLITGIIVSIFTLLACKKYLPLREIDDVSFSKLITYPAYLLGQIYLAGFYIIKVILVGERLDIVTITTELKSNTLRAILLDSITMTPGSIAIALTDDKVMVVWLRTKSSPDVELLQDLDEQIKTGLEKRLLRAQK